MKNIFANITLSLFAALLLLSCGNNQRFNSSRNTKYSGPYEQYFYKDSIYLVKRTYDSSGRLYTEKWYTRDTIPNGAEILYYPNGNIEKWEWFNLGEKNPHAIVYYKEKNGEYDSFKGCAILRVSHINDGIYIQTINPPNVPAILGYRDWIGNKIVKQEYFGPGLTDSVGWTRLPIKKSLKGHKYTLHFYFADTVHHVLIDSASEDREMGKSCFY